MGMAAQFESFDEAMRALRSWAIAVAALSSLLAASACKQDQKVSGGEVSRPAASTPTLGMPRRDAEKASRIARAALKRSAAELDSTFARLEHVEGLMHLMNALDAWDEQQPARAGAELQTAADNLERGAKYVHLELDARTLATTANARAAARRLQQSGQVAAGEFWQLTGELDAELRSLGAKIGRKT